MPPITGLLLVGCGGFLGSICRFLVSHVVGGVMGITFPYGTFMVNISGTFLLGFILTFLAERGLPWGEGIRYFFAIGFLGAYTTFSTFEYESHALLGEGNWLLATANLIGSLVVGLVALRIGILLARMMA